MAGGEGGKEAGGAGADGGDSEEAGSTVVMVGAVEKALVGRRDSEGGLIVYGDHGGGHGVEVKGSCSVVEAGVMVKLIAKGGVRGFRNNLVIFRPAGVEGEFASFGGFAGGIDEADEDESESVSIGEHPGTAGPLTVVVEDEDLTFFKIDIDFPFFPSPSD